MKKYKFNMVEIALAMVIIALGISGVLGLFSVGVNAKKEAISENNIADAAEYVLGLYRAFILFKYDQDAAGIANIVTGEKPTANDMSSEFDISGFAGTTIDDVANSVYSHVYTGSGTTAVNFNPGTASTLPKTFVYAPSRYDSDNSVRVTDCEIAGAVWSSKIPVTYVNNALSVKNNTGSTVTAGKVDIPAEYGIRVYLELSWPLEKAYADRDKKVFVMDIVNPKPVLKAANVPAGT